MKRREKLILSGIILLFGTVFSLFFTAAIHGLLSRQYESLTLIPFSQCVEGLFTQRQQLLLFLSFEGFIALLYAVLCAEQPPVSKSAYQRDYARTVRDVFDEYLAVSETVGVLLQRLSDKLRRGICSRVSDVILMLKHIPRIGSGAEKPRDHFLLLFCNGMIGVDIFVHAIAGGHILYKVTQMSLRRVLAVAAF